MELTQNEVKVGYVERFKNYLSLLRISHWSKSMFVLLGFIYTPNSGYFIPALLAAFSFCLISSAVYIYNDIEDRSEDSMHPHKCKRPLASDKVSVFDAIVMLFLLLFLGLVLGCLVSKKLGLILCIYMAVNVAYNHVLKLIPVFDVGCIALGFMLRVLAGTIGIGLQISTWLLVAATLLSLFIALNKRRLEMQLGLKHATRAVLKKYNPQMLHWLIVGIGIACFITYLFYTIYARDESFYFILTLPFAAFALWRFSWLATQDVANDDPVNVFLSDRLSRLNLWCFITLTFMALNG
ncbi:MAG: decaprenyl-phosphate phosphoribosyltransferase [Legionella sp.]|nr:MAG: decaprenyl-phosphate phosphoribosyltransferase [Legionella sp.]